MKLQEIKQYDNNAQQHPFQQVEAMAKSIKKFGCLVPILLDKNNVIVSGHCRYLSYRDVLKYEEVKVAPFATKKDKFIPVQYVEDLTKSEVRAFRLAENRLRELGHTDTGIAINEMQILKDEGFDISVIGYSEDILTDIKPLTEDEKPLENTSDEKERLTLHYSAKDYLEVLEMLGAFKEQYEHETNEEAILSMLRQMT